jgi:hypothetical protein
MPGADRPGGDQDRHDPPITELMNLGLRNWQSASGIDLTGLIGQETTANFNDPQSIARCHSRNKG